jgi:hypothetical protein
VDDEVRQVRQIAQYPLVGATFPADVALLQQTGVGGAYVSIKTPTLVSSALELGGWLKLAPGFGIAWNGAALSWSGGLFSFSEPVSAPSLSTGSLLVGGEPVALHSEVVADFDALANNVVFSVNGRKGNVFLQQSDWMSSGMAPLNNPHFSGVATAPTVWDFRQNDDTIATTAWVQLVLNQLLCGGSVVTSFNGRGGDVVLSTADVNAAYANYPLDGIIPTAPSPALGDASNRIATTLFVDESVSDLQQWTINYIASGAGADLAQYALLASPAFSGVPTAPTAAVGNSTGQLATTAFVAAAVTASTTGVSSFNTRTGAVVFTAADLTSVNGATLASPVFTGTPTAPTAVNGTNTQQLATCAFVLAELVAGSVSSFNTRVGAVTLTLADITGAGGAPIANAALTGVPTAPTAAQTVNNTQLATTAYVRAAIAAIPADVTSFNGRTGAVTLINNDISAAGGALLAGPAFSGVPTAPTAVAGTNTTQLATTAFVAAATAAGGGVTSFNGRSGVVTLSLADVTGAGGAPLASPTFTGVPLAPQAALNTNTNQLATCSYVMAQLAAGITSFNGRTGAVTLLLADVTGVGGAPLASPTFTGTPQSTTPPAADNSARIATTAYTLAAIAANAVASFNGRVGAVTLQANDLSAVGGALLAGPAFTGAPTAPTAVAGTSTTQLATTQFVANALATGGGVTSFNGRAGVVTLTAADISGAGGDIIAYAASVFATAGAASFTTPANSSVNTIYRVRMVAGGGGGGGGPASLYSGGGGGGAGQYRELIITGQAANAVWTLAIGANGTGGGANANGGVGGDTSLTIGGVAVVCTHGNGGAVGQTSSGLNANGGAGGAGGATGAIAGMTSVLNVSGGAGSQGNGYIPAGGGSNPMGTGGLLWGAAAANYTDASGYGAGGRPAFLPSTAGGPGTVGAVIVERIQG